MTGLDIQMALNQRRKELGIAIYKLADSVGVTRTTMGKWLSGETTIPLDMLLITAHKLDLDLRLVVKV